MKSLTIKIIVFASLIVVGCKDNSKEKEVRQGIGWAAKTTAKFHPDIIQQYQSEIHNQEKVANWFRRKIQIGLERHEYAKRNRS